MTESKTNPEKCLCPIIYTKNIGKLNSAIVALNGCRGEKFKNALVKVKGFGDIFIAEDIPVQGAKYWRVASFLEKEGKNINLAIPYARNNSALKGRIAVFIDGIVGIETIEAIIERFFQELIKENRFNGLFGRMI